MANILIVEDDEYFRKAISDLLIKKGHTVLEAPNGKIAVDIISLQDFDLVLSDIQMPFMNGIDLLTWSIKNKPIPFIIMTGFSTILETKSAYELGAKEFITKPFKNAELIEVINKILCIDESKLPVRDPSEYCRISIDEFVSGKKAEFDIYIKLSGTKFVKIAHKGEDLLRERILQYKEKGVKELFITKEGFTELVGFNLKIAGVLKNDKKVSQEKKLNFLKYTGEIILAKAFISGTDQEVFAEANTFVNLSINILSESKDYLNLLDLLNSNADYTYSHSLIVSMYSVMIAKKMGFESSQAFFKLSMASMFHDIGKKEIDKELLYKHRSLLTAEERKLIESHVLKGQDILFSIKGIPEDVSQLVYEHHEDIAGLGFPRGIDRKHLHPLSKILQLSNQFVNLAFPGPNNEEPLSAVDAIKHIETSLAGRYDGNAILALKALVHKKA